MIRLSPRTANPPRAPAGGFTLMELLVVTAILGIVVAVIAASLAGGIRVWDTTAEFGVIDAEASVGLRLLEKDLCNAAPFHDIPFVGTALGMSFPGGSGGANPDGEGAVASRIGTVRYGLVSGAKVLTRKRWTYPRPEPAEAGEAVVSGVDGVGFEYFCPAEKGPGGTWQPFWADPTNHPAQVRVRLSFARDDRYLDVQRTVVLPAAMPAPREGAGGERP